MCIEVLNKVLGSFYNIDSLIHNMNSTVKIICTILFAIFSFLSFNFYINLLIIILLFLLILMSNVPIKFYLKSILNIKWFLLFIFIINFIFERNIYVCSILVLRVIYVLLYTMMLLYTTKQDNIIYGLQNTFSPLRLVKVPVNKMAFSIGLALRFIPDLILSFNRILKSQVNRGIYYTDLKIKDKIDLLKVSIVPIFTLSIKKADMLSDSMEVRLYDINKCNVKVKDKFNYFDILILLVHIAMLILIIRKGVFI